MAGSGGPGRSDREGLSVVELFEMFPNDDAAERWFEQNRWPDGIRDCPDCGSTRTGPATHKTMPYRCHDCDQYFSVKKGTVMQSSKLGYQKWAIASYAMCTNLKGVSSMKLHRDLGIRQATAWHMMQRIREAWDAGPGPFRGPVEADETFVGGLEKNKPAHKKLRAGRGTVGKVAVAGLRDRETGQVAASVVPSTDAATLQPFVINHTEAGTTVYTDDHGAYRGIPGVEHHTVKHSVGEWVDGQAHVNGLESFWAQLKRGYHGTFHHLSEKHLDRYVREFAARHNARPLDTIDQMSLLARGMVGKRLRYRDLVA